MKRKIRLKKERKIKKSSFIFVVMIFVFIGVFMMLSSLNKHFTPILVETAELEIGKFSNILINKAIAQVLEDKISTDEIFDTVISDSGEIQTIDFNPIVVNHVLNLATTVVQNNLRLLEEGDLDSIGIYDMDLPEKRIKDLKKGIIMKIPIGVLSKNSLLSNLGPSIPIRMHFIGDVNSNISTKITPYGINNALVEIGVHLEMTAQIILPFTTNKMAIDANIPLTIKMIQGKIPNYYSGGLVKDSSLYSMPLGE